MVIESQEHIVTSEPNRYHADMRHKHHSKRSTTRKFVEAMGPPTHAAVIPHD